MQFANVTYLSLRRCTAGKSLLLLYLLSKKLAKSEPVLLHFRKELVLFTAAGAFKIPDEPSVSGLSKLAPVGTWALVDVDRVFEQPIGPLQYQSQWRVIVAASARGRNWDWATSHGSMRMVFMKPWTLEEIIVA